MLKNQDQPYSCERIKPETTKTFLHNSSIQIRLCFLSPKHFSLQFKLSRNKLRQKTFIKNKMKMRIYFVFHTVYRDIESHNFLLIQYAKG